MNTKTITLTPDQVRAALAGRLTQVRMPVEPQPDRKQFHEHNGVVIYDSDHRMWCWNDLVLENIWDFPDGEDRKTLASRCPWGVVGDRLYAQEQIYYSVEHDNFYYSCDGKGLGEENYLRLRELEFDQKESIDVESLPRWASRITLELSGVRVERLADMTEADAYRCGVEIPSHMRFSSSGNPELRNEARHVYEQAWAAQHGHRHPWASNPWVWVGDGRRVETN